MLKKLLIAALLLLPTSAFAQNPTCPTRPVGDSTNACASTAFVTRALSLYSLLVGTTPITGGTNGYALYDNNGVLGEQPFPTSSGNWVQPNTAAAFNTLISAALSGGVADLTLVPGTYTYAKTTTGADGAPVAVLVHNPAINFTINGNGSTIQLSGADVGDYANIIQLEGASPGTTFTLKNLTLKWQSPPFAQAQMTAKTACVANANGSATFAMQTGFTPAWASVKRIDQFNNTTGLFAANTYTSQTVGLPLTNIGGGNYTVAFNGAGPCASLASMATSGFYTLQVQQFGFEDLHVFNGYNVILDNVRFVNAAGQAVLWRNRGACRQGRIRRSR